MSKSIGSLTTAALLLLLLGVSSASSFDGIPSRRETSSLQLVSALVDKDSTRLSPKAASRIARDIPRGGATRPPRTVAVTRKQAPVVPTKASSTSSSGGKASLLTSIFNLSNNVAGAGILTLAAGKATGTGWVPSVVICVTLAFCSAHTFSLIGKACEMTGETTFKGLWSRAIGEKTSWIVDTMVFMNTFCVSIIYTGLLGDIFSALLKTTNLPSALISRNSIILIVASCILLPLNLIRDLSALGFTSILGLVAVLYTVFFIVVRALDGTYALEPVGKFVAEGLITLPSFEKSTWFNFDLNSLVLMSNLGLAFIAHYNGPSYWKSLENATSERFTKVALRAYTVLALIYVTTMVAGYSTFGDVCQGNILLNYSASDILSTLGRLATGFSIIFGFPLISNGCREGFKNASSALGMKAISDPQNHAKLVTCLLIVTTTLSIFLTDIKLIAGLSGATMGSALVYICPTLIYSKIVGQLKGKDSAEYRAARRNQLFIPFGLFTACMGVTMTLKNTVFS
uniref:Amino acid transporter transmembrane domain-containing protein n=2 Tax=Entomoneis paludosa TaxID=265537 RepID=A0A7S2Y2V6_9STRA